MKRLDGPVAGDAVPWIAGFGLLALVFANFQWIPGVVIAFLVAGCVAAFFRMNPARRGMPKSAVTWESPRQSCRGRMDRTSA